MLTQADLLVGLSWDELKRLRVKPGLWLPIKVIRLDRKRARIFTATDQFTGERQLGSFEPNGPLIVAIFDVYAVASFPLYVLRFDSSKLGRSVDVRKVVDTPKEIEHSRWNAKNTCGSVQSGQRIFGRRRSAVFPRTRHVKCQKLAI